MATVRSRELLVKLELQEFDLFLRELCLNYFRYVEHSSGAFSQHAICTLMEGTGKRVGGGGGSKMTWKQLTEKNCHEWKLGVQQSIPKKEATRNWVRDILFMQLASFLQANVTHAKALW